MDVRTRVQAYIAERELLGPGASVVLGVSGGPDSLCLLHLIHGLSGEMKWTVHVAHLNHSLRPEAAAEVRLVGDQAAAFSLPFHTATVDTGAYSRDHKKSLEESARELRYAFLARVAASTGAQRIAVAHTADDQAETVLMHFLRGSGVGGLRGMLPRTALEGWDSETESGGQQPSSPDLQLIRPLLAVSRAEVEAYCEEHGLHPVRDPSNQDTTIFRNRLRHELLPQLEAYNPNMRAVLQRMGEVMAGEYALLRSLTQALWDQVASVEHGAVLFNRARWASLSVPEQRALLREAVSRLRPGLRDVDFTPLDRAVAFSRTAATGRACDVLGGLRLSLSAVCVTLSSWEAQPLAPTERHLPSLGPDGRLAAGWRLDAEVLPAGAWSRDQIESNTDAWCAYVDADRLQQAGRTLQGDSERGLLGRPDRQFKEQDLRLRARLPGDRFQPLGMGGHSLTVSDCMTNLKIDPAQRDGWPLVVSGDDIVWLPGLRLDERFKVRADTARVVRLRFVRADPPAPEDQ